MRGQRRGESVRDIDHVKELITGRENHSYYKRGARSSPWRKDFITFDGGEVSYRLSDPEQFNTKQSFFKSFGAAPIEGGGKVGNTRLKKTNMRGRSSIEVEIPGGALRLGRDVPAVRLRTSGNAPGDFDVKSKQRLTAKNALTK